jgi:hypothetical protein
VKKWAIILSIIILATVTYGSFGAESEYYVRSVPIYKVYHHNDGFIILYEMQNSRVHRIFVPYKWFQVPPTKDAESVWRAEVFYGNTIEFPYMNIYWDRNGFSHVRLFLRQNKQHPSWGFLQNPNQFDGNFDIDKPDFKF